MIDARNTFRKVNRTLNDFSPEHLYRLETTIKLYRQEEVDFSGFEWLEKHFPENTFQDIEGFCKKVSRTEIAENDWSLNPGRYVGVNIEIEEDFDFQNKILEVHEELNRLNNEAFKLANQITENLSTLIS
jgi:type I restriction enzyme M protein